MPKMIKTTFDKKLTNPSSNREETAAFLANKPSPYTLPNWAAPRNYQLLASAPAFEDESVEQTISLIYGDRTVYKVKTFVRHSPNAEVFEKHCAQLTVWRDYTYLQQSVLSGFAHRIFDHLVEEHDIIISDEQQVEYSKRFWMYRIGEALAWPSCKVYYIDLADLNDDMTPLTIEIEDNEDFLENYLPLGWGTEPEFKDRVFVISKKWPL